MSDWATAATAIGTVIAAGAAIIAAWASSMPWCDLSEIETQIVESHKVRMTAHVHNSGRGPVLHAEWRLERYEGMAGLTDDTKYVGLLSPGEDKDLDHTVTLRGPTVQREAPEYTMRLRWFALFGFYGVRFIDPSNTKRQRFSIRWNPFVGRPRG